MMALEERSGGSPKFLQFILWGPCLCVSYLIIIFLIYYYSYFSLVVDRPTEISIPRALLLAWQKMSVQTAERFVLSFGPTLK